MATTRGQRLRIARKTRFDSARAAAAALEIPPATYGAHERAGTPGGRDYDPEDAKRYARRFGTSAGWLLTGDGVQPEHGVEPEEPDRSMTPTVRVVGYVGAGAKAHFYAVSQGDLDEAPAPEGSIKDTVAVEIRGDSLGALFDRWLVFYDQIHSPVTSDLIGKLCVVGLADDRVLVKKLQNGRKKGRYRLLSEIGDPIEDVIVEWAAKVKSMVPR